MRSKKGVVDQLGALIVPLVVVGVVLAIGFLILAEVKDQALTSEQELSAYQHCNGTVLNSSCGAAVNGTVDTIQAMGDIPGWLPIIVITVIGALLIGLVAMFRRR